MSQNEVSLTPQALKELITSAVSAAVKAAKEPTVIEQAELDKQEREAAQKQEARKLQGEAVLEDLNNRRMLQRLCSHEHRNGDTHCVYIQEPKGPGYLLCQKNQCKIRPGVAPKDSASGDIYDTDLFNRIFQKVPGAGQEIFG